MQDQYFTALADEHRRNILLSLLDETRQRVDAQERASQKTKIRLTHVDLPLLEDIELVQWDRDTHSVTRGANYEELEPLILFLQAQSSCEVTADAERFDRD